VEVSEENGYVAPANRWSALLWATGAVPLVTAAGYAVVLTGVGGPWAEPVSVRQPALVAGVGWALAWATALLLPWLRTRAWQRHLIGGGVVLFTAIETTLTVARAWRGLPDISNRDPPPDVALQRAGIAGVVAVLLVSGIVLLVATVRTRGLPIGARAGVFAGAALLYGCALALMITPAHRVNLPVGLAESFLDRPVSASTPVEPPSRTWTG